MYYFELIFLFFFILFYAFSSLFRLRMSIISKRTAVLAGTIVLHFLLYFESQAVFTL